MHKLKERFSLERIIMVGDRGLITNARIREDLEPSGLSWISALRAPAVRTLVQEGHVQMSLFDERDMAEISAPELHPGERLVVCRNPLLADERARKAERASVFHRATARGRGQGDRICLYEQNFGVATLAASLGCTSRYWSSCTGRTHFGSTPRAARRLLADSSPSLHGTDLAFRSATPAGR